MAISVVHVSATPACQWRVSGIHLVRRDPEAIFEVTAFRVDCGAPVFRDGAVEATG